MTWAPSRAAVRSVAARSGEVSLLPSTTRMWQRGQATEIIDTSRVTSRSQPVPTADGAGLVPPCWLTWRKQPLATVHGGSPNCLR